MNAPAKEYDGIHKYIRITDIDEQTSAYKQDDVVSPDAELEEKYKVKENDILFARTGASTGKSYLYDINDGVLYYAGFLIRGNVKIDNNAKFVFLQTKTSNYKNWVGIMSARSGQPGINSQEYSSYRFRIPSKAEQNKIAQVFSLIDNRIQTQIGAINKHESLIKAIAGELTCEGEKVRLADLVDCHSSTMQENDITNDGYYPVYGATGICGYTNSPLCNEDAIIIVKDGSGVGNIKYACSGFSILGTLCYLTAKQNVSIGFVYCCLINFDFSPYKTGMAIPHIYFKDYGKGKINIKSAAEQQKTKTLLFLLMEKLDVERKLLAQYKLQKQYLLSQMFV